jgi:DNA-directed RNA polymerase specialized sigma24 family protein
LTEKELKQYRKLKQEIIDQEKRINELCDKEVTVVAGKVSSSMKDFPYTPIRVGVLMDDPVEVIELEELIAKKRKRIETARKLILDIEDYISNIPDCELRQIFEYRYVDGRKLREIGELLNMDFSGISKKIRTYINFPTIPQKPVI